MNSSPSNPALVSIVIPGYNCAATIAATIESCLGQTYENAEIIVVNDGSTDSTAQVLQSFGRKIRVVNKANGGLAAARNAGAQAARGEFMAWMDADDLMSPDRIMLQAAVLSSDPAVELVSSDFSAFVNDDADFEASHIDSYYSAIHSLGGMANIYPHSREMTASGHSATVRTGHLYHSLLSGNVVHPPTVMIRRGIFGKIGYFDEALRYNSDYDLILRAARIGCFAYFEKPLLRYRRSDAQMSRVAGENIQLETIAILEKVGRDDPGVFLDRKRWLRRRMAELHVGAAHTIGPSDRPRALHLLARGVGYELQLAAAAYAFARIAVPQAAVRAVKSTWRSLTLGMNCFALDIALDVPEFLFLLSAA